MKLWEKIYLVVITLFLLVLNICNIWIFRSSYDKSVNSVKQTAESSWKHIAVSLTEDLSEMENEDEEEWKLFQSYVSNYSTSENAFELWKGSELREYSEMGSQVIYSSIDGTLVSDFIKESEREDKFAVSGQQTGQVILLEREDNKFTCTSGELGATGYQLVLYENVTEILRIWKDQIAAFVWMEMAASLIMAILLYVIMKRFLEPVSRLSEMTARIAAGDYECRLEVRGDDELSALAKDINHMTGQVREHIEQKEAQAQQKQEFIQALSHELRTPLTSVRGYAELIRNTDVSSDRQMEYIDYIVRESGRMVDITETLRQVMLLQQEEMETEEISLKALGEWLQEMTDRQLSGKNICFMIEAGEGVVTGNRVLVEIFFLNLLRNSFHACTERGVVSVCLDVGKAIVEDNGAGMSEECLEHIYEPFYREDKSRSRKMGGSGLGMYLCHIIADRHHWELAIDSHKGVGTKIEVTFYNDLTSQ